MTQPGQQRTTVTLTLDTALYQTYQHIAERISKNRQQDLPAEAIMAICLRRYAQEHLKFVD